MYGSVYLCVCVCVFVCEKHWGKQSSSWAEMTVLRIFRIRRFFLLIDMRFVYILPYLFIHSHSSYRFRFCTERVLTVECVAMSVLWRYFSVSISQHQSGLHILYSIYHTQSMRMFCVCEWRAPFVCLAEIIFLFN